MNRRQINVLLFGASGMLGQGVLRECLQDTEVAGVTTIGRTASGRHNVKLQELVHADLTDYASIENRLE